MMKKQLNNYDGVLSELHVDDKGFTNKKNKKYGLNNYDGDPSKLELEEKGFSTKKEIKYNLGFLQYKIIKNIIYCLDERQQIGKRKLHFVNSIKSTLT